MRVVVLMSTFLGEQYVSEQIESVLNQLPADGQLQIRDDGSTDRTAEIISSFSDPRISLMCGPNIGFAQSFFALMTQAPQDAEMIMLCDQDDVWLPNKISRAWEVIGQAKKTPTLYCARQELVDSELNPIGLSQRFRRNPSFDNALVENIVTGCTAAFNMSTLELVLQLKRPDLIHFHDWWLYLVNSAFGTVVMDDEATVKYRQHDGNVIGRGTGLKRYVRAAKFMRKKSWVHIMFSQIVLLRHVYQTQLSPSQVRTIETYFDPSSGCSLLKLVFSVRRFRQTLLDEVLLRGLLLASTVLGTGRLPHDSFKKP